MMENKETASPPNLSLESDGRTTVIANSEHVSNLVHQIYFVKLWPVDPDSISRIRKEENLVKKLNVDIHEITETICEKMSEKDHLNCVLQKLNYPHQAWIYRMANTRRILRDLCIALDDLCFIRKISNERSNKSLNSLMMLHGSKNLAEEKQILRDMKTTIQHRDIVSYEESLEMLKRRVKWNPYLNNWQKLVTEIEQVQIQWKSTVGNASKKGNISNYESLKKVIKDQINVSRITYAFSLFNKVEKAKIIYILKLLSDDSLENRRQWMASGTEIRHIEKEIKGVDKVVRSLKAKLTEKNKNKGEAYQRILKLKKMYDGEISHYYQYCSLINKAHQLAEEKDIAALDELSCSEVDKFMLEWKNNKAFRDDYEKKGSKIIRETTTKCRWEKKVS